MLDSRARSRAGRTECWEDREGLITVGMGTPNDMKKYLQNGAASAGVLWDAKALGCLTAWAGLQLAQGKQFQAAQPVPECGLDNVTYDSGTKNSADG